MNIIQNNFDQMRSKIEFNQEQRLKAKKLYLEVYLRDPSEKDLDSFLVNLYLVNLHSDASATEFSDRWTELGELEAKLNTSGIYDLAMLRMLSKYQDILNDNSFLTDNVEDLENNLVLLDAGSIDNLTEDRLSEVVNRYYTLVYQLNDKLPKEEDIQIRRAIANLPIKQIKDLLDIVELNNGEVNNLALLINDPDKLNENIYLLNKYRDRLGLNRYSSSQEIIAALEIIKAANGFLIGSNEESKIANMSITSARNILDQKLEYDKLADKLGIPADQRTKAIIDSEIAKLDVLPLSGSIEKAIKTRKSTIEEIRKLIADDPDTPPNLKKELLDLPTSELQRRIEIVNRAKFLRVKGQDQLMDVDDQVLAQRYRELGIGKGRKLTGRITPKLVEERIVQNESLIAQIEQRRREMGIVDSGIQPDYSKMSQAELMKFQNEVENAYYALKALGINDQDPVYIDDATLAKGLKLLGFNNRYNNDSGPIIGSDGAIGFSNSISVVNPETLKRRFEEREKLIKDMQEIGKKFDGDAFEIPNLDQTNNKELEKKKKEYKRIGTIGKVAINKKGSDSGIDKVTMKDERRGLKRLGYGFLRRRFHKNIDIDDIKKRAEDLDPAQMWSGAEKQIKDLKKKKTELEAAIDKARAEGLPDQQISILEIQKQQYDQALRDGNTKLNEIKQKADPYKRLIEADPGLIKAKTYKQMFAAGMDPNDKISYGKLEKKVRHLVRDERKMKRLEGRMKYRLSPFTRGIFARRRISKIEEMKAKAIELGYKDPDQLQKAGFLNRKVLKRIENKKNLINKAEELGLKPELTTAHELNVEKRIHRFGLNRSPGVANVFRKVMNFGNRTLTSNQAITEIDPIKHRQQRFMPKRLAKAFGAPRRAVQKIINPKRVSEGAKVGKGIFKGILEVKTQLEKGIPEKKDGK